MKHIYQLKVQLKGSRPAIYRTIQVDSDITFFELHHIIQIVMAWWNYHLYQFNAGSRSIADPALLDDFDVQDCKTIKLNQIFAAKGDSVDYEYDFGDGWMLTVKLEKIITPKTDEIYPICIGGKRRGPPEDCGGMWGFENLLIVMADKKHPEYKEMKEWLGGEFDPEQFDVAETNERLKDLDDNIKEYLLDFE